MPKRLTNNSRLLEYGDWGIKLVSTGRYRVHGVYHRHSPTSNYEWYYTIRSGDPRHCVQCGAEPPKYIHMVVCLIEPRLSWWY